MPNKKKHAAPPLPPMPRLWRLEEIDPLIPKAEAALNDYIVAHAEYEEVWAMTWPVMKSALHSRHFDRCQPSVEAIRSRFIEARKKLNEAILGLLNALDGVDRISQVIQEIWIENRFQIEESKTVPLASRYIDGCGTATFSGLFLEDEVPPLEVREELIVRASIGLALLKHRKQAKPAD